MAKLIVGLGNPGYEYYLTPHNLGFMAADRLAEDCGVGITRPEGQSLIAETEIEGEAVVLAKPQTFMNLSGLAVGSLLRKRTLGVKDLLVLLDDFDLPLGGLRIRNQGSAGSHNGLISVIGRLQSDEFIRIRMGIQPEHPVDDLADYVLRPFGKKDLEAVADMVDRAAESVHVILRDGISTAMNRYNRHAASPEA